MKRFIFVTFLFLGWSSYELSNGADFQPRRPEAPIATTAVAPGAPSAHVVLNPVLNPAASSSRPFASVSLITKPAIAPKPTADPVRTALAAATADQNHAYDKAVAAATLDQVRSGL
ncbi:MAG: hypothetical protein ACI8R4_004261, partial [Paracoccaceae bacterium]